LNAVVLFPGLDL